MNRQVKIIPPEAGRFATISNGTKVINADGAEIHGIKGIHINMLIDQPITATIVLYAVLSEMMALPVFVMADPNTGAMKEVESVKFKDGSCWETT